MEKSFFPTAMKSWNSRDQTATDQRQSIKDDTGEAHEYSAKMLTVLKTLTSAHTPSPYFESRDGPIKSVVFSYWTKMLDLVQEVLSAHGFHICRIDGSTSLDGRRAALESFNQNPICTVMLTTIGSAGEGLDFTVANHVRLLEPHWNPMAEAQAVDRVYRIGQQREVTVTRYIVPESIETYIQWVQTQKLKLVSAVVDTERIT